MRICHLAHELLPKALHVDGGEPCVVDLHATAWRVSNGLNLVVDIMATGKG